MNVAFIPVRGGSKSIALKNIRLISGKPLVYWTIKAACGCNYIDKVYVATDSEKIRETVESLKTEIEDNFFSKVKVIGRSAESASDTATTELAMLEFASTKDFKNIILIQATSPLLTSDDLNRGFIKYNESKTDSVLSVVRQKRFHWKCDKNGFAHATNYDLFNRPRRQDFEGYFVENGAFYITSREALIKSRNRISGNIKVVEMKEETFFEIDEPSDWTIIEALMEKNALSLKLMIKPEIKMFLTDCDGCLTDGGMYYSERGDELKKFNTHDGMGFALLRSSGIITGIITSESVSLNRRRADKLKVDIIEMGCKDKLSVVRKICEQYNIELKNVAYVGDDINDIEILQNVGYSCCPADAVKKVKECSKYISSVSGGKGVIRDVVDKLLSECCLVMSED